MEGGGYQEEAPLDSREQGEGGHHGCQAVQGWPDQPGQLEPEEVQAVMVSLCLSFDLGDRDACQVTPDIYSVQ